MLMGDPRNRARREREAAEAQARLAQARNDTQRFVTFTLGSSRFALESGQVKEVVMPDSVYSFPHTMPSLDGVLIRHGTAIPVCNVVRALGGGEPCSRYIIAQCSYRGASYSVAIPVSGACELVQGEREDSPEDSEDSKETSAMVTNVTFVGGLLRTADGTVPLLDMDLIVAHCIHPQQAGTGVPGQAEMGGKEARQ